RSVVCQRSGVPGGWRPHGVDAVYGEAGLTGAQLFLDPSSPSNGKAIVAGGASHTARSGVWGASKDESAEMQPGRRPSRLSTRRVASHGSRLRVTDVYLCSWQYLIPNNRTHLRPLAAHLARALPITSPSIGRGRREDRVLT